MSSAAAHETKLREELRKLRQTSTVLRMAASETPSTTGEQPAGTAVRDLRVAAGIQLRDIARDTGISESHLSRFETGQRDVSPKTYHRIIAAIAARASKGHAA